MSLLAQIIAGEAQAGNNGDSYGVAATIYNRSQSSAFAHFGGSSPLAQATAPGQFEAYGANKLGTPTPYQQSLADSLQNGTFLSMGNPGNATYYNAPNYNPNYAAGVGNNYGLGSNQYSNQFNATPGSSFVLPQAYGPNNPTTSGPSDHPGVDVGASGGTGDVTLNPNTPSTPMDAGMASNTPGYMGSGNPITPSAGAGSGASAPTAPQSKATDTGGGAPINITDPTKIASDAGNTVSQALGGVTSGVAADTKSIESTGTGWLNSIFTGGTSLLVRGGLIMVGLFLLLGAFVFFYVDSKASSQT